MDENEVAEKVHIEETNSIEGKIYYDRFPDSPRDDDGNLGTIFYKHRNMKIGDEELIGLSEFDYFAQIEEFMGEKIADLVVLKVYVYQHSGTTISVTPFSCKWDSGQLGYIVAHKPAGKGDTVEGIEATLKSEIELFDQYISGEIYWYSIEYEGKEVDSCGGYYGLENCREQVAETMRALYTQRSEMTVEIFTKAHLEWLYYDSAKASLVANIIANELEGVTPLRQRITMTDDWQKGCCCNPNCIANQDHVKKYLNFKEDGSIDDETPFNANLHIKWV